MTTAQQAPEVQQTIGWDEGEVRARLAATMLRNRMRANAAVSFTTGVAAVALALPVDRVLGLDRPGLVRVIGLALIVFAVDVALIAGARRRRLLAGATAVVAADGLWVAATVIVLAMSTLRGGGEMMLAITGLVVAAMAASQWRALNAARSAGGGREDRLDEVPPIEAIEVSRPTNISAEVMWAAVSDHELFGRLAANLDHVEVLDGGAGRRCVARDGKSWTETCTVVDEGRRHVVAVDTADYPYPLQAVACLCFVEPTGAATSRVGLIFQFRPNPGAAGRVAAPLLAAGRPVFARIVKGWEGATGPELSRSRR
jgi:hypothetical protein